MKFERTPRFDTDFAALSREAQTLFTRCVRDFHAGCEAFVASGGRDGWPKPLRVHRMSSAPRIWEMTWSFSGPDGRATFEFVQRDGEIRVLWRRIGDHRIFQQP